MLFDDRLPFSPWNDEERTLADILLELIIFTLDVDADPSHFSPYRVGGYRCHNASFDGKKRGKSS
jgi:hypothetical protein